jgi:hypothetical protein
VLTYLAETIEVELQEHSDDGVGLLGDISASSKKAVVDQLRLKFFASIQKSLYV